MIVGQQDVINVNHESRKQSENVSKVTRRFFMTEISKVSGQILRPGGFKLR